MTSDQRVLWRRVQLHALDDPRAAQPFSLRLAKENAWAPGYTRRVMEEYLRFAFLATAAGHPVSPSDAVDQAWHLHLLHTRDYWDEFCPRVLGAPLHHGPARGGQEERKKFGDWYAHTLASYRRFFGEPPVDIWPEPARHPVMTRVEAERHWILRKPQLWCQLMAGSVVMVRRFRQLRERIRRAPVQPGQATAPANCDPKPGANRGAVAGALLFGGLISSPGTAEAAVPRALATLGPFDLNGPEFLAFYCVFAFLIFVLASYLRGRVGSEPVRFPDDGQLDAYALAELADGHGQAFVAALVSLHQRGHVVVCHDKIAPGPVPLPANRPVLERAIVSGIVDDGTAAPAVRAAAKDALDSITAALAERGLLMAAGSNAHYSALAVALLPPVTGFVKIMIGMSRDKPVGFLVALTLVALVYALAGFAPPPRVSRQGRELLQRMRDQYAHLYTTVSTSPSDRPLAVGLFGLGVLATTELKDIMPHLSRIPVGTVSRTSSCGTSSCSGVSSSGGGDGGGGGDSGGGGGCGGCGGGGGD